MSRRARVVLAFGVLALALAAPAASQARTFYGTVGPGFTITLRTKPQGGVVVTKIKAGVHRFVIRDKSSSHNFHLRGGKVNRRTGVAAVVKRTWRIRIRKGVTYRYVCDPHASFMRGSFSGV